MSTETVVRLVGGILLLASNAFFVTTEFALTRLRQFDPPGSDEENSGLSLAWKLTETLEIYLTGCQVGITFSSILLGIVAEPAVTILFESLVGSVSIGSASAHAISITLSVVLINMAHTVWGEQAPTYLGIERAEMVAGWGALPLYYWTMLTYPFIWLGDKLTKATLGLFGIQISRSWLETSDDEAPSKSSVRSEMADLLKRQGLPSDRRAEVMKAYEIDRIPVSSIMVPREEIVTLTTRMPFNENLELLKQHMHARYPLIGESLEDFKGILYTPEILANIEDLQNNNRELDDFDWPRLTVPSDMPVSELIDRFQEEHHELALVMEQGKVTGLVTLTDAFEAIIGSVEDPLDLIKGLGD